MAKRTSALAAEQKAIFGFALPRVGSAQRQRAQRLLELLERHYPHAHCELTFSAPHELLVATILSAQATDVSVNKATPALFARYPAPADYARATPQQIEPYIRTIGLFRAKARAVHEAMRAVHERFGGQVPRTMDELLTLRGCARKTAGVVLGNAFGINMNVVVDTHVHRLSQRLGLVKPGANVQQTERALMALFPRDTWCRLSHMLIFHGRYACKARGTCAGRCEPSAPPASGAREICQQFGSRCELRVSARTPRDAATSKVKGGSSSSRTG